MLHLIRMRNGRGVNWASLLLSIAVDGRIAFGADGRASIGALAPILISIGKTGAFLERIMAT